LFVATVAAEPGLLPAGVDWGAGVCVDAVAGVAAELAGGDAGVTELAGVVPAVDELLVGNDVDADTPAGLNT